MPRGHWARAADEPEMMDMDEPVAEPHVANEEEEEADEQPDEE
jgi:hypothetical protein